MLILALYYTLADMILIAQVLYYRRLDRTSREHKDAPAPVHLNPATPLLDEDDIQVLPREPDSQMKTVLFYSISVLAVLAAGVCGYFLSPHGHNTDRQEEPIEFDTWGQVFGYLCALFYLGSRLPQIILNFRRKTCEGLSLLFFLFACLGNITYVISILSAALLAGMSENGKHLSDPTRSWRYILTNTSWLIGSAGTLVLDGIIFAQFFMFGLADSESESSSASSDSGSELAVQQEVDERSPLLR
jgi:hypothetical protein